MSHHAQSPLIRRSYRTWMCHDAALNADLIDRLWENPDALMSTGIMLKDGDRSTVVRIESDGRSYTLKRYNMMSLAHSASHLVLRSRGRWNWINSRHALEIGLTTPRPQACLERRIGPFRCGSYYLSDYVEGEMLLDLVRQGRLDGPALERLARGMTDIWRTLGRGRTSHGDMKATNFIVDGERRIWLLDLDGMRHPRFGMWWRRLREKDRARFRKNWRTLGESAEVFLACVDTA